MNVPKNKETSRPRAKIEPVSTPSAPEELSADWQGEFMAGLRLERARIPRRFSGKLVENFETGRNAKRKTIVEASRAYINTFNAQSTPGLLITGGVGCGKTHIAVAILQGIIRRGFSGLYYNMPDLLSDIRATYGDNSNLTETDLLDDINEPDLLVLDDLGAETAKDWVNDRLYLIVNRRYESCKPIIVTTNLDVGELTHKLGERTVSRLCEMCETFAPFPDEDYRKKNMH